MYLKRLEIQGFKSFANQTLLEFQPGITSIVGPNGSGKSNIADAVRWVLGEQSKTLLRGRKAEDVIFVGSAKKARSATASVSVVFDNQDKKLPIDSAEVVITRRLHRDGTSEYLINNELVRLMDITEALAQSGFGQSRYTVIGQGIIDQFLLQGPGEIKAVIEEAASLAPFYEKHDKTVRRLEVTAENLNQVKNLIAEIEPRLRTLRRQAKRLEQRAQIESQWRDLFAGRLAFVLSELTNEKTKLVSQINGLAEKIKILETDVQHSFAALAAEDEASTKRAAAISDLQNRISSAQRQKEKLQIELTELAAKIGSAHSTPGAGDLAILRAKREGLQKQQDEIAHQLRDFENNLAETERDINEIIDILNTSKPDLVPRFNLIAEKFRNTQKQFVHRFREQKDDLRRGLEKLNLEIKSRDSSAEDMSDSVQSLAASLSQDLNGQEEEIRKLQSELQRELQHISTYTSVRQESDKKIRGREQELSRLVNSQNDLKVNLARVEARIEEEQRKAREDLGGNYQVILDKAEPLSDPGADEQVLHLKRQLEMIGGLDEMTLQEYEETETRYTYLTSHVHDLEKAAGDLEKVLTELNEVIKEKFNEAFGTISAKFSEYFRLLFNGGRADLRKIKSEKLKVKNEDQGQDNEGETDIVEDDIPEETLDIVGVDVAATPPGKKLSSVAALSGGERTLTAIALLIALLDAYPSPFVVLDEVDAALDESNSIRFAKILGTLSDQTQFITITHNREIMRRAHTLYGVTMSEGGVSQILSIKFDQSLAYAKD